MAIVVDASVLIDAYLVSDAAPAIAARLRRQDLHAPVTVDAEVLHGLRRHVLGGTIVAEEAEQVVLRHRRMIVTRHPVARFVARMWSLRHNLTAYDAAYVALAEQLDLPLLTRDRRLSRSSGHGARIEYID